ncbi:Rpn family recombination-promoting nuclease/putative transposase [Butyrivibrio sp. AD3002]|uniref:Rpn family recombination-promoting nuclease/putative transposase n=1 Tax=Butyrivibrio sp. AD3002 TaxID=1280670 RepID=UPI0003B4FE0E|nr:Rpn family recombination-promoting nuclease/putative transposase [Butyrivibrio sp. AD3002]
MEKRNKTNQFTKNSEAGITLPASGTLEIPMTNDYLFRALLQRNNHVLQVLIQDLLHLPSDSVVSVTITNPIVLGETIDAKTFILDINVLLGDNANINLEMQVINEQNWPERSLSYLCRNYDTLNHGENYLDAKTAYQIGILNFTLFEEYPEFYASYKLINEKTHHIYSDKLQLRVLDLTQIELATDEDKAHNIDYWAKLFNAKTWEELNMLASEKDILKEASETVYTLTQEEKIRLQCQAREDYYRTQNDVRIYYTRQLEEKDAEIEALKQQKDAEITQKDAEIEALKKQIEDLKSK